MLGQAVAGTLQRVQYAALCLAAICFGALQAGLRPVPVARRTRR